MRASARPQLASERVVVLLKPTEKRLLEKLARLQRVSSAEILRRSLHAYQVTDEAFEKAAIAEMNTLLDGMLETLRTTREQVQRTLARVDQQGRVQL